jgi:hypothetical protein
MRISCNALMLAGVRERADTALLNCSDRGFDPEMVAQTP